MREHEKTGSTGDGRRLAAAERDLERMLAEIAPFVKKRERRSYSTAGQWEDTRRAITKPLAHG